MSTDRETLLAALPDEPRFVEARALLLSGIGEVRSDGDGGVLVVDPGFPVACAVGLPSAALLAALDQERPECELLVQAEDLEGVAAALPERVVHPATCFRHPAPHELPRPAAAARVLEPGEPVAFGPRAPEDLVAEIEVAVARRSPLALCEADGEPAAFAYAFQRTETLWDVSVDTLEHARRRGLATAAFLALAHRLLEDGVAPAWGSLDRNAASLAMAAKLGFRAAGKLYVLVRR